MMKTKTSELTGAALDWAVAKCERFKNIKYHQLDIMQIMVSNKYNESYYFNPTKNWAQGGPIIEWEGIVISKRPMGYWVASCGKSAEGDTPLIAAMRCYVASKLGDEVEIPEELVPRGTEMTDKEDVIDEISDTLLQDHMELMKDNAALRYNLDQAMELIRKIDTFYNGDGLLGTIPDQIAAAVKKYSGSKP